MGAYIMTQCPQDQYKNAWALIYTVTLLKKINLCYKCPIIYSCCEDVTLMCDNRFLWFLADQLFDFRLCLASIMGARNQLLNPLSGNLTKWSNTLKQFVGKLPTNCLSVFDHFVGLALKGLIFKRSKKLIYGKFIPVQFFIELTFTQTYS